MCVLHYIYIHIYMGYTIQSPVMLHHRDGSIIKLGSRSCIHKLQTVNIPDISNTVSYSCVLVVLWKSNI